MILKSTDDRSEDLSVLETLFERPGLSKTQQSDIKKAINAIRAGIAAEKDAAYHIDFGLKNSPNWIVIHDLRIEEKGRVAQIDHLLINRLLEFWICETKYFSQGIAINDFGEFTSFYGLKPISIPSPIEQNLRHQCVLEDVLKSERVCLPLRMRRKMTPKLSNHILISTNARISRPKQPVDGIDTITKIDQFNARIEKWRDSLSLMSLHRVISCSTLESIGQQVVKLHIPAKINWEAKFGLEPQLKTDGGKKKKLICKNCDVAVPYNTAKYCWFNKSKFGENIYCWDCQQTFGTA